jgi:hypothetical protein
MAFEDKEAEPDLLLETMQNEPEDRHKVSLQIRRKLNELKAYAIPLPHILAQILAQDLVQFELEAPFAAASRARLDQPMARRACRVLSA